jgi:hypothetical protein
MTNDGWKDANPPFVIFAVGKFPQSFALMCRGFGQSTHPAKPLIGNSFSQMASRQTHARGKQAGTRRAFVFEGDGSVLYEWANAQTVAELVAML